MQIEYEATFENVDKDEMRERLKKVGAKLERPEFRQKRVTLSLPKGCEGPDKWLRVRDEGNSRVTMSYKNIDGNEIHNQKELLLVVDDFENAVKFLTQIGCQEKSFQETKRELWTLDGVEISIDEWPFLEPFIEVEGKSEEEVKRVSEKLEFDYGKAMFGCVTATYARKYGLTEKFINNEIPKIIFDMENPFANAK